jgi:hypothetical protein
MDFEKVLSALREELALVNTAIQKLELLVDRQQRRGRLPKVNVRSTKSAAHPEDPSVPSKKP